MLTVGIVGGKSRAGLGYLTAVYHGVPFTFVYENDAPIFGTIPGGSFTVKRIQLSDGAVAGIDTALDQAYNSVPDFINNYLNTTFRTTNSLFGTFNLSHENKLCYGAGSNTERFAYARVSIALGAGEYDNEHSNEYY